MGKQHHGPYESESCCHLAWEQQPVQELLLGSSFKGIDDLRHSELRMDGTVMEHNWAGVDLLAEAQSLQKRKMSKENICISKNTIAASLGGNTS